MLLLSCRTAPPASPPPVSAEFRPSKLLEMDKAIRTAIAAHKTPGGVLWLERKGDSYHRAYGHRSVVPDVEPMTQDTIFDLASLTKVIATTPSIMLLVQDGRIKLDAPAQRYLPEFLGHGKEKITIRQLLTHTSGLRPDLSLKEPWHGYAAGIARACREIPTHPPGTHYRYSDINFIVLGEIVRRVSGEPLNQFAAQHLYQPLKMVDTGFLPAASKIPRIAPTQKIGDRVLRGIVHDPTARRMGGVAGHAGLFSTARDLARFARMMLNYGELDGVRIFRPDIVRLMTSVQSPPGLPRRGLGWDIDSPYAGPRGRYFPIGSYGHTGWTGTSIWIDPFSRTFWIFLSNRNHPTEAGSVIALRRQLGTLAAEAVRHYNFTYVPGALPPAPGQEPVKAHPNAKARPAPRVVFTGIDVLEAERFAPLAGLRVGLITNQTGQDRHRHSTIDLLDQATNVQLKVLFSPEHGIRGVLDRKVSDSVDSKTGLPIYSLYGARHAPTPAELTGLDALVFDIQAVGCRFYTFITTMGLSMEAAAHAHIRFFVLDRPNPINGVTVAGPVLEGPSHFTGFHPIPIRYGMTIGELAQMFRTERHLDLDLTVIPLKGWLRSMWFDQTELPWTNPSPNMRRLTAAILYPGIGLLETTALSVGRGTDTPFEILGAPYIDDIAFVKALDRRPHPGIRFVPVRFTPHSSTFSGQRCGGVQLLLLDRETCHPIRLALEIAQTLRQLYPQEFALDPFGRLLCHPPTLGSLKESKSLDQILSLWTPGLAKFRQRRARYLLYPN